MNTLRFNLQHLLSRQLIPLFLFLVYLGGFIIGSALSYSDPYAFSNIDKVEFLARPSFFLLLIVHLLPVFLLYIFERFSLRLLCYPLVFLLALSGGYCDVALCYLFGEGAWLIRTFLLCSRCIVLTLFWLLLFYKAGHFRTYLIFALIITVVTFFDFFGIAPFISNVFTTI